MKTNYDRKLSASMAKEKSRLRDSSASWYGARERKRRKKRKEDGRCTEPPKICAACVNRHNKTLCIGCPFYKAPDSSTVIFK